MRNPKQKKNLQSKNNGQLADEDLQKSTHHIPKYEMPNDLDPCPLSGEPIDNIYWAVTDPVTGKPARFDKVLEKIIQGESISDGQHIAYIGAGEFGIIEQTLPDQKLKIVKRIPFEDSSQARTWRRKFSHGISRDYQPAPEPLNKLYTAKELKSFPKLGTSVASKIY